jgi:hypothetical protein
MPLVSYQSSIGCISPWAVNWLTSAAWKMTMSGGVPAITDVGYFWKKRSHGMPWASKHASGLASAYCWSMSAKTAPSAPVRPCIRTIGSSHWPKALTTGVGSGVGALGSTAAASAAVSAAPLSAGAAAGVSPPQAASSSAITIRKVRTNENLRIHLFSFLRAQSLPIHNCWK